MFAAAVSQPLIEAIVRAVVKAGLEVVRVAPGGAPPTPSLNLFPSTEARVLREKVLRRAKRWSVVAGCLWLIATGTYTARLGLAENRIGAELEALRAPLEALRGVRREMAGLEASRLRVEASRADAGVAMAALASAAGALPDSTYLTSFEFADGRVRLTGVAPRARRYLARLEALDGLPEASLEGAPIRQVVGGAAWERFSITLENAEW